MYKSIDILRSGKVLLAITFAGNMFTASVPAMGQQSPADSSSPVASPFLPATTSVWASSIENIAANSQLAPDVKAFYLLQLAGCYITESNTTAFETAISKEAAQPRSTKPFFFSKRGLPLLAMWAERYAMKSHFSGVTSRSVAEKKISAEHRACADRAIDAAMVQLGSSFVDAQTANLFLAAASLSRMSGNTQAEQRCNKILNDAIQACEVSKSADSSQIKLVAPILNSMACGIIPVQIEDHPPRLPQPLFQFDEKDFAECKKIKLRTLALLDRLPVEDQQRRKGHRDLSLWYSQLGKDKEALREKQELFNLVGVHDDRILYPHYGTCGAAIWWTTENLVSSSLCGMG